jgi:hypothetical protein
LARRPVVVTEVSCGLPQSLQENTRIIPQVDHGPLPLKSFPIHRSFIIISSDTLLSSCSLHCKITHRTERKWKKGNMRIKLTLFLIKRHGLKILEREEVYLHTFLTSSLSGGEWLCPPVPNG